MVLSGALAPKTRTYPVPRFGSEIFLGLFFRTTHCRITWACPLFCDPDNILTERGTFDMQRAERNPEKSSPSFISISSAKNTSRSLYDWLVGNHGLREVLILGRKKVNPLPLVFHTRAFAETVFTGRKRSRKIIDLVPSLSPFFLCSFLICLWKMHLKCLFSIRNCPRCIFSFLIVLQTITFGRKCRRTASQKRSIWRMVEWLLAWAVPETKYAHQSLTEQKVLFTQKIPFKIC